MRSGKSRIVLLISLLGFLWGAGLYAQYDIPPKPSEANQKAVYDYVNLLSKNQSNSLNAKLIGYADSTSTQIVVSIIESTKGEDISFLGAKWGQAWGIGQADRDNGILILLARDDRQIDINTGYGIETILTDRMAEQILNRIIIPEFKNGDYYSGLDKGTDALIAVLSGEYEETRTFRKDSFPVGVIIFFIIIILIIIFRSRNSGNNGNNGGGSLLDVIILSHMGRTGGSSWGSGSSGGGWSSGGGFGGGFGGGGFGGGGASGGW